MDHPFLTIGMATYDDFDGVFYSVQALRMYHDLDECEIVVVDNNPTSEEGKATKAFIEQRCSDIARYVPFTEKKGSCPPRGHLFDVARGEYTMCIDSHVFLEAGAIEDLKRWLVDNPTDDLLHGPLLHNDLQRIQATHMTPQWRSEMFGTWGVDHEAMETDEPFDIPQHGLGLFCAKTSTWLKFNPRFDGFSGGEGYIHEKYRKAGRRVLCLPFLKWMHKFARPRGVPHRPMLEQKIKNHLIGWHELGMDLGLIWNHFVLGHGTRDNKGRVRPERMLTLMRQCGISNFNPDGIEKVARPNTGMIIGPSSWGSFIMRGEPVAKATGWSVQNSRGKVQWLDAETCFAVKCDVPPIVQQNCKRIVYMPMDQWFESRQQMTTPPSEWLAAKCKQNGVTDLILESPAAAALAASISGVTVHMVPHHADPRVNPGWHDPNGPVVYAGHRCFVEKHEQTIAQAAERCGKQVKFCYTADAWRALEGASLVLALRYHPYATPMHRFLKPAVKVANAAQAGIPVVASDHPAITSLYPNCHVVNDDVATCPKRLSDAMSMAMEAPVDLRVHSVDEYVATMCGILGCKVS